jgi:tyrosine-protein kinase
MNDTTDTTSIFAPLWKRKWLILAVALLVAAGTYLYYKRQPAVYSASTELYFGGATEQQGAGTGTTVKPGLSGRALSDQAAVINSAIIGEVVRKQLRREHQLAAAHGKEKATSSSTSSFLTITTEARTPRAARLLANTYAQTYIRKQRSDYLQNIKAQIVNLRIQLRRIEPPIPVASKGKGTKAPSSVTTLSAAGLATRISQLENALSTFSGVQQVGTARATPLPLSPAPKKNAIFGFVLGLLLASIAAYAFSRLDRRVRSLPELERLFSTQILAALPTVRPPVVRRDGRSRPAKGLIEPLRRLHTTLALGDMLDGNRENVPRTILVVSPDAGDGRSMLIANLARVQADAGDRVAVIEADFRRPTLKRLLDVSEGNGLAEVLAGKVELSVAMQRVPSSSSGLEAAPAEGPGRIDTIANAESPGSAWVLLSGGPVANPPAALGSEAMTDLLRTTREDFDYVLIDAPPPLEVSDAIPLFHQVDGILVLARLGHTREVSVERLALLLARSATVPLLGVVANCAPRTDIQRYGFVWAPVAPSRRRKLIGR